MRLGTWRDFGPGFKRAFIRPRVIHVPAPTPKPVEVSREADPGNPGREAVLWRLLTRWEQRLDVVDVASGRTIHLYVAPNTSAVAAVASTFGLDAVEYAPVRAT